MPVAITPQVLTDLAVCWPPSPVGLRPPCVGSQQTAFSHPDCRGFLILFVARHPRLAVCFCYHFPLRRPVPQAQPGGVLK